MVLGWARESVADGGGAMEMLPERVSGRIEFEVGGLEYKWARNLRDPVAVKVNEDVRYGQIVKKTARYLRDLERLGCYESTVVRIGGYELRVKDGKVIASE